MGTAPFSMTTRVCSLVPLAMLVNAHADSNCRAGLSSRCKNSTNFGTTPASMTFWIGGLRSEREKATRATLGWVGVGACRAGRNVSHPHYARSTIPLGDRKTNFCQAATKTTHNRQTRSITHQCIGHLNSGVTIGRNEQPYYCALSTAIHIYRVCTSSVFT